MRALMLVVALILGLVVTTVPVLEVSQVGGDPSDGVLLVLVLSTAMLALVPLAIGSGIAYWPIRRPSPESRSAVRRWLTAGAILELAGLAGVVVTGLLLALPAGEIVLEVVIAVALAIAVVLLGLLGLRHQRRTATTTAPGAPDVDPQTLRRARRNMLIGAVIGFGVGLVLTIALLVIGGPLGAEEIARAIASPIGFGGLGAGIGGQSALLKLGQAVAPLLGGDFTTRRTIARNIVRGRRLELAPEDQAPAARFAAATRTLMPYRYASSGAILVGALSNFIPLAVASDDGTDHTLAALGGAMLLLAVVITGPVAIRQHRNVVRYSIEHPVPAPIADPVE